MSILSATTQHWYHLVEGEEERAKLTPQRDAILAILAQIPYDKFPELVEDLLVEAEGHIRVDVTDGPGDEKQDILTKTKAGERHLTQCKHTTKHTEKSSGDGLDVLFGACHRKNCRHGLYVTNGELTPQAKRYITDDEFRRLASGALELDYWDAKRIWERIERSPNVLKKWFGGMVQADGLRLFYFDIVVQNCPRSILLCAHQMIDYLGDPGQIGAPDLKYTVEESVKADAQIDVPYVVSEERAGGELSVMRVRAEWTGSSHPINLAAAVEIFAEALGRRLPEPDLSEWWHIICTGPETLVHFMDLERPVAVNSSKIELS